MSDSPIELQNALPSLEYLLSCSKNSLQDVELANLNRAANCLKQAKLEWDAACAGMVSNPKKPVIFGPIL